MLTVGERREQQRVGRNRFAEFKTAEPAQQRRAHAVNNVPQIQRHKQLFRPVRKIGKLAAVEFEKITLYESEHHQVKGIVAKQTV